MGLEMHEKRALTNELVARYRRVSKAVKKQILDEFILNTGYNRKYAIHILRHWNKAHWLKIDGKTVRAIATPKARRKRMQQPIVYDDQVIEHVIAIWDACNRICGKRLVPILRTCLHDYEEFAGLVLEDEIRYKLMTISAATIDRRLAPERKRLQFKGRCHTKPGTMLKHQIPIRTFADWNEKIPGFVEIDLVGHDNGIPGHDFCFTLTVTDVVTGWTEFQAIRNKAYKWVAEALIEITARFPVPIRGIDCDNGSEFINHHMVKYCKDNTITFTRGRPYKKNDNCFVEQKNGAIIRKLIGYGRFDTDGELEILNQAYDSLRMSVNYFLPSVKLLQKTRKGSKVVKKYDDPKTAYERLMVSPSVAEETKERLRTVHAKLNLFKLQKKVEQKVDTLYRKYDDKNQKRIEFD
jgi:hypothetical protein